MAGLRAGVVAGRAAIGVGVALCGCASSDPLLRVEAAVFTPSFDGDVGLSSSTVTDAETIDLVSALDLGDTDVVPYLRAEIDLGPFNVAASGFATSQDGTGITTADFGNISAGSTVDSEIDLTLAQGRAIVDLIDTNLVKLGLGLAVEWVDFELDSREQTLGLTESVDVAQLVPLVAAHASAGIDLPWVMPIRFDLNVAGMSLRYEDIDGTVLDVEALLRGDGGRFGWFVGYRHALIQSDGEVDGQDFDGDITVSGWLIGLNVRI